MPKHRCVEVRAYRSHRIEVIDDGAIGWKVRVLPPDETPATTLVAQRPNDLAGLLDQARLLVDERHASALSQRA